VVHQHLVSDPSIQQPGYMTDQDPCHANLHKWGLAASEICDCGQRQSMGHIVD